MLHDVPSDLKVSLNAMLCFQASQRRPDCVMCASPESAAPRGMITSQQERGAVVDPVVTGEPQPRPCACSAVCTSNRTEPLPFDDEPAHGTSFDWPGLKKSLTLTFLS